ncbi:hypothetical protein NT6N_14350 [Oceaniferula spumae]|uniref:Uncharacterized protein n=1 Tax=Oceaniferula spumae TaxID=2979115 RepID=A0AAT9FK88_9BACT
MIFKSTRLTPWLFSLTATAALLLTLLGAGRLSAQYQLTRQVYETKTNTWVQVTSLFGKLPAYGYVPIRVEINNGTKVDRDLSLEFTSKDLSAFGTETGSRMSSSFECSCEAGKRETFDFLVPVTTVFQTSGYGSGSELRMNISCNGFPTTSGTMSTELSNQWPSVIVSSALYVPNASALTSQLSGGSMSSSNIEFGGSFDPKSMPTDWRAYLGQDVIMLTSDDWSKLDPGARTAILEWNRFGGRLIIYSSSASVNFGSLQIDSDEAADTGSRIIQRSMGTVSILSLPSSGRLDAAKTYSMLGAGVIAPSRRSQPVKPGFASSGYSTTYYSMLYDYAGTWPLENILGQKHFNTAFFVLILLAFGILIGPVNLFVFAKAGKRHKLFITTPIISLGASALLVILILFQDGFGGRGHRVVLMEIQPQENNAYIIQEQAARTGVLLGSSFETSEPALMSPVALAPSRWARVVTDGTAPSSYTANEGDDGLKASGDWFQSRSIHGHLLKTVRPTRGRIELSPRAGAPVLTSTFDYDLGTIYYQAKDGSWWKADALSKGNSVTLSPSSASDFHSWLLAQSQLFSKGNAQHINDLATLPGRFFTLTEDAPAIETYNSVKWLSTKTLMTGRIAR